jgi:hypothetical protein
MSQNPSKMDLANTARLAVHSTIVDERKSERAGCRNTKHRHEAQEFARPAMWALPKWPSGKTSTSTAVPAPILRRRCPRRSLASWNGYKRGARLRLRRRCYFETIFKSAAWIIIFPPVSMVSPVTVTVWVMCGISFALLFSARPPAIS